MGKSFAEKELTYSLKNRIGQNIVDNENIIIKDSVTAINMMEPILFKFYGKSNIENEKPFETYLIENYWVIMGTLPKGSKGGTFTVVLDAKNGEIIRLTHGK